MDTYFVSGMVPPDTGTLRRPVARSHTFNVPTLRTFKNRALPSPLPTLTSRTSPPGGQHSEQVEESYREYHKTAFTAAAVHPSEATEEMSRVRAAIAILFGLRPPPDMTTTSPSSRVQDDGSGGGEVEKDGGGMSASEAVPDEKQEDLQVRPEM